MSRSVRGPIPVALVALVLSGACAGSSGQAVDVAALLSPAGRSSLPAGAPTSTAAQETAAVPVNPAAPGPDAALVAGTSDTTRSGRARAGPSTASAGPGAGAATPRPGSTPTASPGPTTPPTRSSPGTGHGSTPGGPAPTPGTSPPTPAGRIPGAHPGVTDSTITLGIPVLVNYDNVVAGFASKRQSVGDIRGQAQAVISQINGNGGMAGRQVVPVFHEWDSGDGTFASQAQKTCAAFTEDHKVLAVTPQTYGMDTLAECLSKRDTALVGSGDIGGWADQDMLDRYARHLYMPNWLNFSRWGPVADGLADQGFFSPGAKVGLLYLDQPIYRSGVRALTAGMARHGVTPTEQVGIPFPEGTSGVADMAAPVANAVLRFRSRNIDRVLFVEGIALVAFLFMPQAESQGYRPRYGMSTGEMPSWLIYNTPREQWTGVVGMGFLPQNDVDAPQDPGGNPTRDQCLGIYARAGIDAIKDRFREHSALGICGNLLFLKAALDRAPEVSSRGLQGAVDALGSTFRSPLSFATRLAPNRHDGGAAMRPFAYDATCGCTRYTGPPRTVP